jgi:hypothetical protein
MSDWEKLGYMSGQSEAERAGAYYDPMTGAIINGLDDSEAWQARGVELAAGVILALEPERPKDAQFQADCQRFADGFAQGYALALI